MVVDAMDIDDEIHWRFAEQCLEEEQLDRVELHNQGHSVLAGVGLLVFDFDGVFTDNRVYLDQDGGELVGCSRSDGLGIEGCSAMALMRPSFLRLSRRAAVS